MHKIPSIRFGKINAVQKKSERQASNKKHGGHQPAPATEGAVRVRQQSVADSADGLEVRVWKPWRIAPARKGSASRAAAVQVDLGGAS